MRVLITGHRGQLGRTLMRHLDQHTLSGLGHPQHDVTKAADVQSVFEEVRPELVIHAAALTDVDYCARHPGEALRVNLGGTQVVALACLEAGVPLLYVSTNEVFDGLSDVPYREYDPTCPINAYGYSKLAGEQFVRQHLTQFYITRTAWLYAKDGTNFLHHIIAQARAGKPLRVVDDEVSSPTYVEDMAAAIAQLTESGRFGTYHLVNEGACSRYEFAQEALSAAGFADAPVESISGDEYERASTPPPYSPLANELGALAGIQLRPWQTAVADFARALVANRATS